ncbi:hypothetical protein OIU74_016373 [Salix koriyanagi]|uniref:Uncharacterized protein n=1 Tax=Salix koriyanagi TaxID=2511006 RepID=A0A9Q0PGA6_9ROSI|nr:hypothetical protein OIU74_016373 [Salix koriyanagi]
MHPDETEMPTSLVSLLCSMKSLNITNIHEFSFQIISINPFWKSFKGWAQYLVGKTKDAAIGETYIRVVCDCGAWKEEDDTATIASLLYQLFSTSTIRASWTGDTKRWQ